MSEPVTTPRDGDVSTLLRAWSDGDQGALDQLTPIIYDELRRLAGHYLRQERTGHSLQATALVNEAYLRLTSQKAPQWRNRAHFFGVAAQLMRRILVDHARSRHAAKRGGRATRLALDAEGALADKPAIDLVVLDDALGKLAQLDAQQARVIEMRFFGGLSIDETAVVLDVSSATVKREWVTARAWLRRELKREAAR